MPAGGGKQFQIRIYQQINQTKHRIYFLVKTKLVAVPFINETTEVTTSIPINETVIVEMFRYYLSAEILKINLLR